MAEERELETNRQSAFILFALTFCVVFFAVFEVGHGSNQIVSKSDAFTTDCRHPNGTVMADGEHSSNGSCDAYVCHVEISGNYYVYLNCPSLDGSYNPDPDNCAAVSNSTMPFPSCCPKLQCSTASPLTTVSPTACYDRSSDYACSVWSNLTSGCTDYSTYRIQNFTTIFCEKTCGICT